MAGRRAVGYRQRRIIFSQRHRNGCMRGGHYRSFRFRYPRLFLYRRGRFCCQGAVKWMKLFWEMDLD